MQVTTTSANNITVALISSDDILITDVQSALDLMATINYEYHSNHIVLDKSAISEEFFDLSTRLAGDILQKFTNYQVKLAIVGDFSGYRSKSLRDFIYESNKGSHVFFLPDQQQAIAKLTAY